MFGTIRMAGMGQFPLMAPHERRALLLVLGLGIGGHLLRAARAGEATGPPPVALFDPATDGDPLAHRDRSLELARPLAADERIDIDRAGVRELERLPGVGPALARRIVADRESRGAFGGIEGLDRVSGIGPATLERLAPHLTFSGRPADAPAIRSQGADVLNRAGVASLDTLPGIGPARAQAIVAFRDSAGPFRHVTDLRKVPGLPASVANRLIDHLRPP